MPSHDETSPVAVCAQILQPGFRVGPLVLRPARVSVAEGAGPEPAPADEPAPEPQEEE